MAMLKQPLLLLICALALPSCKVLPLSVPGLDSTVKGDISELEYKAISPRNIDYYTKDVSGTLTNTYYEKMSRESIDRYLGVENWYSCVEQYDKSGNLTYLGSGATGAKGHYKITLDYSACHPEDVTGTPQVYLVGVGIRIIADVYTSKSNISITSLPSLVAAYENSSAKGSIDIKKIGIISDTISSILPPQGSLNKSVLEQASRYVESVNTHKQNPKTVLKPYIIGVGTPKEIKKGNEEVKAKKRKWPWG